MILKKSILNIPVVGISKGGAHSQSASKTDVLVFPAKLKKSIREILISQKNLFQQVRNEAHRFSIKALRRAQSNFYEERK